MDELTITECRDLLTTQDVGRVAVCTPQGPQILPVNYTVDGASVVFRTAPYSQLSTYGWNVELAIPWKALGEFSTTHAMDCKNENELAAVMAHEYAHVFGRPA